MASPAHRRRFEQALAALDGHALTRRDGFVCRAGREAIFNLRRRRRELAARRWPPARRFARWLTRVPFLRMVAVCGSHAVENGGEAGDVDLFLVTEPGRLWIVHTCAMALRRIGRVLGIELCPNYLLTTDALEVPERDLYTAREIAQAMPLWGEEVYERFLVANRWIKSFLPQVDFDDRRRLLESPRRGGLLRAAEKVLAGRLGDSLDRGLHRALMRYYQLRLRRHGWTRADVENAYRRDRQVVITGGFGAAVARRFLDAGAGMANESELRRTFFGETRHDGVPLPDPLYDGIMDRRYGSAATPP